MFFLQLVYKAAPPHTQVLKGNPCTPERWLLRPPTKPSRQCKHPPRLLDPVP